LFLKARFAANRWFLLGIKREASWLERQRVCFCHHSYRCWLKRRPSSNSCFVLEANYNCESGICTMLCRTYQTSWHEYQDVKPLCKPHWRNVGDNAEEILLQKSAGPCFQFLFLKICLCN
jgi:hypothetical protein